MDLTDLLVRMVDQHASDLFVSVGAAPHVKVEGKMIALGDQAIDPETAHSLAYSIMNDEQMKEFEETFELNMALHLPNVGRFRVNVYRQRGEPALVARFITGTIPSLETLGLPERLGTLIMEERGLILVVGATGTGKSTTLASMIDHRNQHSAGHILTIEDPVEFVHEHKQSIVDQREVGLDTLSFGNALINAMRESPDVIMIGEVRDQATMKHALAYAETGHLCLATLHANNANQALDRILNFFPETAHRQILMDLSLHLKAIVSQRLAKGLHGRRVPAVELMINTPYIAELIQNGKIDKIKEAMTQGKTQLNKTFDEALYELWEQDKISEQEALRLADSRNNMALRFRLEQKEKKKVDVHKPIIEDVAFNKHAPFSHYHSFRVKPLRVEEGERKGAGDAVANALRHCFGRKNMREDSGAADIEIQFVLGIKSTEGLAIQPFEGETDPLQNITPDSDSHATLVINIVDTKTGKPVWRLSASRNLTGPMRSQDEINEEFMTALAAYPPEVS